MEYRLWYKKPAERFSEALPLGNGTFGAMVYGNFPRFAYSLNADTLWSGGPESREHVCVSPADLEAVRRLVREGKNFEAEQIVQEKMTGRRYNESYLSAGFLRISFQDSAKLTDYTRELSLNTASARTEAVLEDNRVEIQSFLSCKDGLLVTWIRADSPVTFVITTDSLLEHRVSVTGHTLELCGEAPAHVEPNYAESEDPIQYGGGMRFAIRSMVQGDGTISGTESSLKVCGGKSVLIFTSVETGYRGFAMPLEERMDELRRVCSEKNQKAAGLGREALYERHLAVYQPLFDRVVFSNGEEEQGPVDEQLQRLQSGDGVCGRGLCALLFQYGRYLLICSSLPTGPWTQPTNLQGIWCEDIRPMWSCNYTVNINTEMNYWLAGPGALGECELPLIRMIEETAVTGRETARETFGCGGWAACHNIDLWRGSTPVKGEVKWAYWPMGGVWLTTHLYRHYLFTDDREFLEKRAYPIMRESAEFCLDWMYEEDGLLHTVPSTSPENTFYDDEGRVCAVCDFSTMDRALIREMLENVCEAGELLGEDADFLNKLKAARDRIPEYEVGSYGQLLEWTKDYRECDSHHRHFAHLVGFHPFHQIDFDSRPELLDGIRTVLRRRTEQTNCHIGWTEAWIVNFFARLRDGDAALGHLNYFLKYCSYPNLFSLHPPLGENAGEREIFQIDGNLGVSMGILEMLMFTKPGVLHLLPALPTEWESGEISGLIACGGHEVQIRWEEGRLADACIKANREECLILRCKWDFAVSDGSGMVLRAQPCGGLYGVRLQVQKEESYKIEA